MLQESFRTFLEQQNLFCKALKEHEPDVRFPLLRGGYRLETPSNWFVTFIPPQWGNWKGATYGVHFDLIYGNERSGRPECFRLTVGVEAPMDENYRQAFKEEVIRNILSNGAIADGYNLQAASRKKLLEADPIPFGAESWQLVLGKYKELRPVIDLIGRAVKEYAAKGAFSVDVKFPHVGEDQSEKLCRLLLART